MIFFPYHSNTKKCWEILSALSAGKINDSCQSALYSRKLFCTPETKNLLAF